MRIVYIVPWLYNSGGIDRVITIKANYLTDVLCYNVTVITLKQGDRIPFFKLSSKIKQIDLNISDIAEKRMPKVVKKIVESYNHKKRLETILDELQPDIVLTACRSELPFLYKLNKASKKVYEQHFTKGFRLIDDKLGVIGIIKEKILLSLENYWLKNFTRYVVLTKEEYEEHYNSKPNCIVIPNPITITQTEKLSLKVKRVLAVGRICYQKGFDRLLHAWILVSQTFQDWHLSIVGSQSDIYELEKLKNIITEYSLTNVELIPETHDISKEYLNSSLFVMSSRCEGFALVLIEAMSCGIPCVSFDCKCGPKDIITDGVDGLLVKNGDIKALADAMMRLMGDEQERKRMGANALIKSKQYSLPIIMQKWDELFKSLL